MEGEFLFQITEGFYPVSMSVVGFLRHVLSLEHARIEYRAPDPVFRSLEVRILAVGKHRSYDVSTTDGLWHPEFALVAGVMDALYAPGMSSSDAWDAIGYDARRSFLLEALEAGVFTQSKLQVRDLITAYNLAAESGETWRSLI